MILLTRNIRIQTAPYVEPAPRNVTVCAPLADYVAGTVLENIDWNLALNPTLMYLKAHPEMD